MTQGGSTDFALATCSASRVPENGTNMTEQAPTPAGGLNKRAKPRSCVVCRSRKVRCDKLTPCTNCQRGNVPCIYPSNDRTPRWARRLERLPLNAGDSSPLGSHETLLERIRILENLVSKLRGQLEQARKGASSYSDNTPSDSIGTSPQRFDAPEAVSVPSGPPSIDVSTSQKQFGRLVLQEPGKSRYVSSSFWSRVDDVLSAHGGHLSEDDASEASSMDGSSPGVLHGPLDGATSPFQRHAFLFGHIADSSATIPSQIHPLPSQIPFLVDVFSENINVFLRVVHIPTVMSKVHSMRRNGMAHISAADEALILSICYASIVSLDEEDVKTNFEASKTELSQKYRFGLEHALARADFLNNPDTTLMQAFAIFVCLARRHESPRFVWMMVGLLVKMAQFLGLHRDPTHFAKLTIYDVHMRRRIWWVVLWLDQRAAEDQGTDLTIAPGSFDTKRPSNIDESDIDPSMQEMPPDCPGMTDMSYARIQCEVTQIHRDVITYVNATNGTIDIERSNELLNQTYKKLDQDYLQHTTTTQSEDPAHFVLVTVARLIKAKLTLCIYLPYLFTVVDERYSKDLRNKLLISAIEVAEYNHDLNARESCKPWRWIYQTHIHWHAVVYMLLDIGKRSWSAMVERAWVTLRSKWLIPAQKFKGRNPQIWVPLGKLMRHARKHREAELERLRGDRQAVQQLDLVDQGLPAPSSSPLRSDSGDHFRDRWRRLVTSTQSTYDGSLAPSTSEASRVSNSSKTAQEIWSTTTHVHEPAAATSFSHIPANNPEFDSMMLEQDHLQKDSFDHLKPELDSFEPCVLPNNSRSEGIARSSANDTIDAWLWTDSDFAFFDSMDADENFDETTGLNDSTNWYEWVNSAQGV